jgi:hypothetical protein
MARALAVVVAVLAKALAPGMTTPAVPAAAATPAPSLFVVADSVGLSAKDAIPRAFRASAASRPARRSR